MIVWKGGVDMPRGAFNPIEYYLVKTAVLSRILKEKPQCTDCEHMHFLNFSPESYESLTLKKYCPSCPKFNEVKDNANA